MNICRTCMEKSEELIPIFSKFDEFDFIATKIIQIVGLQILEDDGLPNSVCSNCMNELRNASIYINKSRETDRKLRKLFKGNVESEDENEEKSQTDFFDIKSENYVENNFEIKLEIDEEGNVLGATSSSEEEDDSSDDDYQDSEEEYEKKSSHKRRYIRQKPLKPVEYKPRENPFTNDWPSVIEKDASDGTKIKFKRVDFDGVMCCGCLSVFETSDELKAHSLEYHANKPQSTNSLKKKYYCTICYRRYTAKRNLTDHQFLYENMSTLYECECSSRIPSERRLQLHANLHPLKTKKRPKVPLDDLKTLYCCSCSNPFDKKESLIQHALVEHSHNKILTEACKISKPFECDICFRRYQSKHSLEKHRRRLYRKEYFMCSQCGLNFNCSTSLNDHESTHDEQTHECKICQKRFISKATLKCHIQNVHVTEKKFVCTVCGWSSTNRIRLTHHSIMHSDLLAYQCKMCGKKFKSKQALTFHYNTHNGIKPFKCRYCEKTFGHHTNRKNHEIIHTGIKPYSCSFCEKSFMRKKQLLEHQTIHTGINPLRCDYCSRLFDDKKLLQTHVEVSHPEYC
uniref:Putative nucleic acid binding protein n=1 Tax=Corethrella appendiculata TaxID=1370023 RepID=U5ETL7_9DIPT